MVKSRVQIPAKTMLQLLECTGETGLTWALDLPFVDGAYLSATDGRIALRMSHIVTSKLELMLPNVGSLEWDRSKYQAKPTPLPDWDSVRIGGIAAAHLCGVCAGESMTADGPCVACCATGARYCRLCDDAYIGVGSSTDPNYWFFLWRNKAEIYVWKKKSDRHGRPIRFVIGYAEGLLMPCEGPGKDSNGK